MVAKHGHGFNTKMVCFVESRIFSNESNDFDDLGVPPCLGDPQISAQVSKNTPKHHGFLTTKPFCTDILLIKLDESGKAKNKPPPTPPTEVDYGIWRILVYYWADHMIHC